MRHSLARSTANPKISTVNGVVGKLACPAQLPPAIPRSAEGSEPRFPAAYGSSKGALVVAYKGLSGAACLKDKYRGSHELQAREEWLKAPSDRNFGCVFAAFCAIIVAVFLSTPAIIAGPGGSQAAAIFALLAYLWPDILAPLNRLWTKLGVLLFTVISPIVLWIIFFTCVAPIGWIMRLAGKDPLRLRFER